MNPLQLPTDYIENHQPTYHLDSSYASSDIIHQPDVYTVADYLLKSAQRTTIIDIGCGNGRKLRAVQASHHIGVDFGENIDWCRAQHTDWGEWIEVDLSDPGCQNIAKLADHSSVLVCADVVEHLVDPIPLVDLLADAYRRGAIVLTSTPDRIRVRGSLHRGPPTNPSHVREWALDEYRRFLTARGLPSVYAGYTLNNNIDRELKTIITIHDPLIDQATTTMSSATNPVAIVAAYNEVDIAEAVVVDLIDQGCDVVFIDNWSTDGTFELLRLLVGRFPSRIILERFPADGPPSYYEWQAILRHKEEIALQYPGRWIMHADADEIRRSPFNSTKLREALETARRYGCNRINSTVIDFRPTNIDQSATDFRQLKYFEYGRRPGHFVQWKTWLQGTQRVDLASCGGHPVRFAGMVDFPYKLLVKHYPIRSQSHGLKKIIEERQSRWSPYERQQLGWHTQYDRFNQNSKFIWDKNQLNLWDDSLFWAEHGLNVITDLIERSSASKQ
jgi:SAM-dependent methyltransferase